MTTKILQHVNWRRTNSAKDGAESLLFVLDGNPSTYQEFAEDYYECSIDLEAVTSIYQHQPLTAEMIKALNPEVSLESLASDLEQIAYPAG